MNSKVIHIGLPKCGSTTLQMNVFSKINEVTFWNGGWINEQYQKNRDIESFLLEKLCATETDLDLLKREWLKITASMGSSSKPNVISEEMLSSLQRAEVVSERLYNIEPNAKILLVLRPRKDLLRSLYDMRPLDFWNKNERYVRIDEWLEKIVDAKISGNFAHVLEYGRLVSSYKDRFGNEQVHVLTLEELTNSHQRVLRFFHENLAITPEQLKKAIIAPKLNPAEDHLAKKIFRRFLGPIHASWFLSRHQIESILRLSGKVLPLKKTKLTRSHLDFIANRFADDQKLLLELMGEDSQCLSNL